MRAYQLTAPGKLAMRARQGAERETSCIRMKALAAALSCDGDHDTHTAAAVSQTARFRTSGTYREREGKPKLYCNSQVAHPTTSRGVQHMVGNASQGHCDDKPHAKHLTAVTTAATQQVVSLVFPATVW
jgi:hypothetical protein